MVDNVQSLEDRNTEIKNAIFNDLIGNRLRDFTLDIDDLNQVLFTSSGSWRLTIQGDRIMQDMYENNLFKLDQPLNGRQLITLKQHMERPYFLDRRSLRVYHTRDAFKIKLKGSVADWLDSLTSEDT